DAELGWISRHRVCADRDVRKAGEPANRVDGDVGVCFLDHHRVVRTRQRVPADELGRMPIGLLAGGHDGRVPLNTVRMTPPPRSRANLCASPGTTDTTSDSGPTRMQLMPCWL